ncbi:Transition state regulatory protein AbrB [compost metagenome]
MAMKATGIVRKMDDLGRVVIPSELRRTLGIEEKDGLEIFVEGDRIILQKYAPGCTFCGDAEGIDYLFGKPVCGVCVSKIKQLRAVKSSGHGA